MKKFRFSSVVFAAILFPSLVIAAHTHPESWYQEKWCAAHGGRSEVILQDLTRVDCLTDYHAIEFDFSPKWAEAIGQALHYAQATGKEPGIVIIVKKEDGAYVERIKKVSSHFSLWIKVWVISEDEYK